MNVLVGAVVVVVVTALTVGAMLLVRRRAPAGSYFSDGDRASGVFGVMATGFSVMLGFIIFLAFTSYDASRTGAATEASAVAHQFETAQYFPEDARRDLSAELVCYARSVAGAEWDSMEDGTEDTINPWSVAMFRTVKEVEPASATEQSAYDRWMDLTVDRQDARNDRVHGVAGVVPTPLWIVLYVIAAVIFVFMLFFADSAERATTQAMLMGGVSVVVTSLLLLLVFLDSPYVDGVGGLQPDAMGRTLQRFEQELQVVDLQLDLPCAADGTAR